MKAKSSFAFFILLIAVLSSCRSHTRHKMSFFDSVAAQMELSAGQIRKHTVVDKSYFTARSKFKGDTIYYARSPFPFVIVHYSDGLVCSEDFLLVYNRQTKKNTDVLLAETDCDEDYSTDYSRLSFKILNKTQIYTREVRYVRDPGKKTRVVVIDKFYQVNKAGKIDSLKQKPAGVIVPVYVQPDDIDDTADDSLNKKP